MNVFVLGRDPRQCAESLHDKHVIKMCLETAQIISTAARLTGNTMGFELYEPTHEKHPWVQWAIEGMNSDRWRIYMLLRMCMHMSCEYRFRWAKATHHESWKTVHPLLVHFRPSSYAPNWDEFTFPLCMPDAYKQAASSPIEAYRLYYMGEKMEGQKWTKRGMPTWIP